MRIGVRLGPFYASTGTRRRRRPASRGPAGCGSVIGWLLGVTLLVSWPLALRHALEGWAWVIVGVWWGLLALVLLLMLIGSLTETPGKKDGSVQSDPHASGQTPNHPVPAQQSGHPGPAEVRDVLIAVVESALDNARERDGAAADQVALVLRQMRAIRASDDQFVRLARLIPDTGSIPPWSRPLAIGMPCMRNLPARCSTP